MWRHLKKLGLKYKGYNGSGTQVRDVIHIDDVCNIINLQIKKIRKINNITFNIGGGPRNKINLKKLTKYCQKITNNKVKIKKVKKTSNYDVPYYVTDNKKFFKFFNYKIKKNINKILIDIYLWQKKNLKSLNKIYE